jgi:hypothetical protein
MAEDQRSRFTSLWDFNAKLCSLFRGPTFYSAFTKLDRRLRKKIMITVSIVNNCTV